MVFFSLSIHFHLAKSALAWMYERRFMGMARAACPAKLHVQAMKASEEERDLELYNPDNVQGRPWFVEHYMTTYSAEQVYTFREKKCVHACGCRESCACKTAEIFVLLKNDLLIKRYSQHLSE
jgi:hypothetical protein